MIRSFQKGDELNINANGFSSVDKMAFAWDDSTYHKRVLVSDGAVYAIIFWTWYCDKNYIAGLLISKDIKPSHMKELRKAISDIRIEFDMDRVETNSVRHDTITRWHKFLGFTLEGTKMRYAFGRDYDMWAMVKGRDY